MANISPFPISQGYQSTRGIDPRNTGEPSLMSPAINLHNSTIVLVGMILIVSSTFVLSRMVPILSSTFVLQYNCIVVYLYYSIFVP